MENKRTNEDYAKNYPVIKADQGFFGPFSVGNIAEYDGRDLINVCVKTQKSGDKNAMISFPKSWGKAASFAPGDQVNVFVEQGFIRRISHAKAKTISFSAASVNREVAEQIERIQAEQEASDVVREALQSVPEAVDTERPF